MSLIFIVCILLNLGYSGCNAMATTKFSNQSYVNTNPLMHSASILNGLGAAEYENINDRKSLTGSSLLSECDTCPEGILCVPPIQCPAHVRMQGKEKPQVCYLPGDVFGFCCVTGQNLTVAYSNEPRNSVQRVIPKHILEEIHLKFKELMRQIDKIPMNPGHPQFMHGMVFHSTAFDDLENFHLNNLAMKQLITTKVLRKNDHISIDDLMRDNIAIEFKDTPFSNHCQSRRPCNFPQSKYRTYNGICNNRHPLRSHWGSAGQSMNRLLPPAYDDGIWLPRQRSIDGGMLANARDISRTMIEDLNRIHHKHNLLLMQFGQFLAHDIMQSAAVKLENGELVQCCSPNNDAVLPPEKSHIACLPIKVSPDDEFYSASGVRCINFVRLALAPNSKCRPGYGKQRSKVTHFLDASTVYGSSNETALNLRSFEGGRLKMFNDMGHDLLPLAHDKQSCGSGRSCFKSGDGRTNQIISLVAVHILFAREHNRLAGILARLNPHASDETLYQEARRIVIAELQHIVYNEYLPAIIGPSRMKTFKLNTLRGFYSKDYDESVNPAITNEFSGAAFRMGHSSVAGHFNVQHGQNVDVIDIPDVMFNPKHMRNITFYDDILNTLLTQPMQTVDIGLTHGLTRFLFRGSNSIGLDLAAINIQRGRDMGLNSYNDYLHLMGYPKLHSFNQFSTEVARRISMVYRYPDDIDLWVGGLLEKPVEGGIVGKTFAEIIADQFSRFKRGDRYYYEYDRATNPGAFTMRQLNEIRKVTMARIICDNADHFTLGLVQPKAFVRDDFPGNQPLRCDDTLGIPAMDMMVFSRL